jgi:L-lactate dehydrogenase
MLEMVTASAAFEFEKWHGLYSTADSMITRKRVGVIGTGRVGMSVAISVLQSGLAEELLLHDVRSEVAEGEAMDLVHGASFCPTAEISVTSVEELVDVDAVVVTAGRNGRANESRLDLLRDNAAIIRRIGERLVGCRGTIIVVTNPVDVLTAVMRDASGLPTARVLGTGTMLDTARLRYAVGRRLKIDPHSIHAHVVGEHGDSGTILWSSASVGGVGLRRWPGWEARLEADVANEVRTAAYEIIRRKGATNHAIGLVAADLLRCVLRDERRMLTVSRMQEGACGIRDVALSLPSVVGAEGAVQVVEPEMNQDERDALDRSADILRRAM